MKLKDLRDQRNKLVTQMRAITDLALKEKRDRTGEEEATWDRIDAEQEKLGAEIRAEEARQEKSRGDADKLSAIERELAGRAPESAPARPDVVIDETALTINGMKLDISRLPTAVRENIQMRASKEYAKAFDTYLRTGYAPPQYQASLQADSDPAGGSLIAPIQFVNDVLKKVRDLVFIRQLATVRTVVQAQSLGVPTLENDPADSDWTSELATGNEDTAMNVGRREWHPHPLAKLIKLSNKLIRLTAGGAQDLVMERLAYKFAVTEEKGFIAGSGASQPLGVFTASASGISTARDVNTGNTATAMTADGLIEAKYKLKAPYQQDRSCAWLFHRDGVKAVRKLKDTNGQYLWSPSGLGQASLATDKVDRILEVPFFMSEYAPNTFTTGLYVGIIGAWSYYWIADALDFTVQRLLELYAATNQVGYIGRKETDAMPVFEEAFARVTLA